MDAGAFYLAGTRITSVGDPVEDQDAATKLYVDTWSPLNNIKTYKYVINNKRTTFMNLSGLLGISTSMTHTGQLSKLLGCQLRDETFYFNKSTLVKDKYLQIEYLHPVWVKEWSFFIDRDNSLNIDFMWQASVDGTNWVDIVVLKGQPAAEGVQVFPYYKTWEVKIPNPTKDTGNRYKFWRMYGLGGILTYGPFYNFLLMKII